MISVTKVVTQMENKVEHQKVTEFFGDTVFADADNELKTRAYEEVSSLYHTLWEMYVDMIDNFYKKPKFFEVVCDDVDAADGTLCDVYRTELYQYFESYSSSDDSEWVECSDVDTCDVYIKSNKDLTDENIKQLIVHLILMCPSHQLDPKDSDRKQFINLTSLLLSRFTESGSVTSEYLFSIIIAADDLEMYKFYTAMFEQHLTRRKHYNMINRVMNKHGFTKIYLWFTPQFVEYLLNTVDKAKCIVSHSLAKDTSSIATTK